MRLLSGFLLTAVLAAAQDRLLIHGAWLVDGTGAPVTPGDVLVENHRISQVGPSITVPPGAAVIDASGKTLLPGLFDLHTHVGASPVNGAIPDWYKNLMAYSWSGVTTVVDLGAYPEQYEPVRRLLAAQPWSPHLLQAARFSSPGGHGLEGGRGDFHTQSVLTPREARAALRRILPYKPDVIKVFTDGWRYGTDVDMTSMDEATLIALVDEAHKNRLKVLTHTVTIDKGKIAARAGVDIVAHGMGDNVIDEEWLGLLRKHGTAYVPTLAVYEPRAGREASSLFLDTILDPLARELWRPSDAPVPPARKKRWEMLGENVRRARDGGIAIGAGTDAGMGGTFHGWALLHELELLASSGMTPLEALTSATGLSARLLGVDQERGSLRPGRAADLVLVDGKPFEDIHSIFRVARVWIGGVEVDRDALTRRIATPGPARLPAVPLPALLDDFERPDGRSRVDTLWLNATDPGHDHSRMTFERTERQPGDHVLTVLAEMSEKDAPHASVVLPLTRGAVLPADARSWRGLEFDLRGGGEMTLLVQTRGARPNQSPRAKLSSGPTWKRTRVAFDSLENTAGWSRDDLVALEFRLGRPAGQKCWFEIDNLALFQ